jgi:hypothetical protein
MMFSAPAPAPASAPAPAPAAPTPAAAAGKPSYLPLIIIFAVLFLIAAGLIIFFLLHRK